MNPMFQPEGRRVGWLLTEVERQTTGRLSDESRHSLLDEVACHLDAAIQARLELGMNPIEAELEAVEAFGPPKAYVDDLLRVHESANSAPRRQFNWIRGDRRTIIVFSVASIFAMLCFLTAWGDVSNCGLWIGLAIVAPIFAFHSFKARRIQAVPIFIATLAAFLVFDIGLTFTWHNLYSHGGMGVLPRWRAADHKAEERQIVARIDPMLIPLQHRIDLHRKYPHPYNLTGATTEEMRELMSYPVVHPGPSEVGRTGPNARFIGSYPSWSPAAGTTMTFEMADTIEDGTKLWRADGKQLFADLTMRRKELLTDASAIEDAQSSSPLIDFPNNLAETAGAIPVWFALWAGINFVFGGLGWLLALPRFHRRPKTA